MTRKRYTPDLPSLFDTVSLSRMVTKLPEHWDYRIRQWFTICTCPCYAAWWIMRYREVEKQAIPDIKLSTFMQGVLDFFEQRSRQYKLDKTYIFLKEDWELHQTIPDYAD